MKENIENAYEVFNQKKVLCLSGGIDSLAAWFYEKPDVAVYFNLGTKYTKKELACLQRLTKIIPNFKYTVDNTFFTLGKLEDGDKAFIPYRNLLIGAMATRYGNDVIIAGIKGDKVSDKNPKAFEVMQHALDTMNHNNNEISIRSPFWDMTKSDIIGWMKENVPNHEKILKTSISCYNEDHGHCGECPACFRKWIGLKANDIDCDKWFNNPVKEYEKIPEYISRMAFGEYDPDRTEETMNVFIKEGIIEGEENEA